MLTALTCEREMLTFPLPARIKTLARDTEHDHTSSSTDFYFTKYFSIRLVDFGSRPSQKDDHSEESSWSLREKNARSPRMPEGRPPLLILSFVAVGVRLMVRHNGPLILWDANQHLRSKSPRLVPLLCLRDMPKMKRWCSGIKHHCLLAYVIHVDH